VRKQYHFQPGARRLDAWDVDRLVALTRDLLVKQVRVAAIWELDSVYWSETMTPREVAAHLRLTNEVDVQYPIILGADGRIMDGMHRVLRALLEGRESIDAVQFDVDPEPDYLDVMPDELPYPDVDSH
jgi:hypothetical protein